MSDFKITEHYRRVRQLNMNIDPTSVPREIKMPKDKVRLLRAKLIFEETLETIEALGVKILGPDCGGYMIHDDFMLVADGKPDMVEIADGCADTSVVIIGTLVACGIHDMALLELVDRNNLAKFGPGGYRRDDGKWIKPPDHEPPDIAGYLRDHGWREGQFLVRQHD